MCRVPLALVAVSAFGLSPALLADGAGNVLAWLALAAPAVVLGWCTLPRVQRRRFRTPAGEWPVARRAWISSFVVRTLGGGIW